MNLVAHFALVRSAHETLLQKCFSRPLRGWGIERRSVCAGVLGVAL